MNPEEETRTTRQGTGHVGVQVPCGLNVCQSTHQVRLTDATPPAALREVRTDHSGVAPQTLSVTPDGVRAAVDIPRGVLFTLYPPGSANAYTLHDAADGTAYPLLSASGCPLGGACPGPDSTTTVHRVEGEVGFGDTEHGVHFTGLRLR